MYSMVCSPSTPCHSQTLEVCVEVQGPTVQDSDDGSKGLSTCAPMKRGQSEDLDSEISEVPRTSFKVASSSKLAQHYGSPCVQQKIDDDCQTSSDSSRDLYLEGLAGSSGQVVWHGSPSLDSSMDVYRPILPSGSHLEEKVYSYIENQSQVSPCMHPVSKSDQQPSSDVSEDLSMCPKPRGTSSNIVGQKEETVSSKVSHNEIAGRFENHDEISKLIEAPSTAKAILSSGLFDGFVVSYRAKGGGVMLTGAVKNGGIMCNCRHCKGRTVVNISCFEKHAGSTARHPSENIFFENGKSLLEVMRNGWYSSDSKSANATERVIKNSTGAVVAYSDMNSIKPVTPNQQQRHQAEFYAFKAPQTVPPAQKRDLNKLLFLPGGLADGTEVAYYMKGQRFLTGTKMGHGILCDCCNEVISCSLFEAHAGWGSRRNPYQCIFLSDGRSLHKYAQSLAIKLQENSRGSSRDNEDLCAECGDGGDLVLCDACPLAYHSECVGLPNIPEGEWFCPQCDEKSEYASNDRKQGGEKRMQQHGPRPSSIARRKDMERCQRIVKASDNTIGGCVICKNGDFLKTGFGAKTVLLCDQCEREFHVGCLKEKAIADLQELPAGEWFCGPDCTHIQKVLKKLVLGGPNTVCNSICKAVLDQKEQQKRTAHVDELTWQLLHGRRGDPRNGKILSEAATILAESFDPIVDAASGRDLISVMVHSRNIRDQDFGGMYCAVLKKKDAIVSTAVIRIFGKHFAEMPLVATSTAYRGQGFFQILMLNIEKLLGMLRVEHLVLPATTEAEGIWINKFGFSKLNDKQVEKIVSQVQIMMFQGSLMLSKRILQ
ncbi:hypothetical protein KP509_36G053700 [Ceratopteris richardii]|nr:hypothetical protein KP509_36G053700 [Ceratopteris richardii]KAH7281562.1 hypothetical protein KP509_36G053700 [Ceratopteris richardii]KAH7281564.1 hypothetical protein KP509_36G053700 [Ceratopteris richardii]